MKKRTRNVIITVCVAVVVASAVLVGVFVGKPMVERQLEKQRLQSEFVSNEWGREYEMGVPLNEVDPAALARYTPAPAIALPLYTPSPSVKLALPIDVNYYSTPDASGEPAYTIPKGTEVSLYREEDSGYLYSIGYGYCCYPDYQEGWRYGKVFVTEIPADEDGLNKIPMYYVQTEDLETVAATFWEENRDCPVMQNYEGGKSGFAHWIIREPDRILYDKGYFCSPDLP